MGKNATVLFRSMILDGAILTFVFVTSIVAALSPVEEELLMLGRNSLIVAGTWGISAIIVLLLHFGGVRTLGNVLFDPPKIDHMGSDKPWFLTFWGMELILAFIIAFVTGIYITDFDPLELFSEDGWVGTVRIFSQLVDPNFSVLPRAVLAIIETIFIAFMATVFAVPVAFVMSFLCAKNVMGGHPTTFFIYTILRSLLNVTRSIEPLIWAIVFSVWVGIGPFSGMLALLIHSIASLAKNYSELVECVDEGPIEAIQATGGNALQVIWFAIVPQIVLPYTAFTIYRWDINVRMATIIGLVGGGGIGTMLIQYQGQAMWREVGCLVIVIAAVVWVMDATSAYIREAIK